MNVRYSHPNQQIKLEIHKHRERKQWNIQWPYLGFLKLGQLLTLSYTPRPIRLQLPYSSLCSIFFLTHNWFLFLPSEKLTLLSHLLSHSLLFLQPICNFRSHIFSGFPSLLESTSPPLKTCIPRKKHLAHCNRIRSSTLTACNFLKISLDTCRHPIASSIHYYDSLATCPKMTCGLLGLWNLERKWVVEKCMKMSPKMGVYNVEYLHNQIN